MIPLIHIKFSEVPAMNKKEMEKITKNIQKGCHDIQNIVALIYGNCQLMSVDHPELNDDPHWVNIQSDINSLVVLMKSINHYRYAHVVTKAPEMLADIINTSISHFPELRIKCNTYVYARVMADSSAIIFVMDSLFQNIYDVSHNASVNVDVSILENYFTISVKDFLPKIPDATSGAFFNPFNSLNPEKFGLSLATSAIIVAAHGGALSYRYENGNSFTFTLKK